MDTKILQKLLIDVAEGRVTPNEAAEKLKTLPYEDLDYVKIDTHRALRTGRGEVIFGIGKTPGQVAAIMQRLSESTSPVIATKVGPEYYEAAREAVPECLTYYDKAKLLVYSEARVRVPSQICRCSAKESAVEVRRDIGDSQCKSSRDTRTLADQDAATAGHVAVVCAGTADIPIAEEAAVTSEVYGVPVDRYFDVGVSGVHRLLDKIEEIRTAKAIVVVAGMEGALSSVIGGLVEVPVIAVPTSIGYGASMGGLAALLAMLNSCSLGVSVVNIDNGFGAGFQASLIVQGKK